MQNKVMEAMKAMQNKAMKAKQNKATEATKAMCQAGEDVNTLGDKNLTHIFPPRLWHDPQRLCADPPGQPCCHIAPRQGFRSRHASGAV